MRRKIKRKIVLSPHRRGNVTSVTALQRKLPLDKKAALRSKIKNILRGRSRFVIRKVPVGSARGRNPSSGGRVMLNRQGRVKVPSTVSKTNEEVKDDR